MNNIMDTISEGVSKHKNTSFFEEDKSVSAHFNRLFGREKPVHHILGGGKCKIFSLAYIHFSIKSPFQYAFIRLCSCWCDAMEEQEDLS